MIELQSDYKKVFSRLKEHSFLSTFAANMPLSLNTLFLLCWLLVCSSTELCAQNCKVVLSENSIDAGDIALGSSKTVLIRLTNEGSDALRIESLSITDTRLYESCSIQLLNSLPLSVNAGSSIELSLLISARHNVHISAWISLRVRCACTELNPSFVLKAQGVSERYAYCYDIEYQELYDSLRAHVVNHNSLGYKAAREVMFGKADNVNDSVECIYTAKKLKTSGIPPNGEFNTEHTWVQSRGSSVEPNKSDIHHLYPTNPNANSIRANYPFGTVSKLWKDAGGGSRLGFTAKGDTVFEPRDVSKGNIARSIFYYLLRYGNVTNYYNSPYAMDAELRRWNSYDPPDAPERSRCDTIAAYQGKRNPFVDSPELVERMDFQPTRHDNTLRFVQRESIFDPSIDSAIWSYHVVNRSTDTLRFLSVNTTTPEFVNVVTIDNNLTVPPHQTNLLRFRYKRFSSNIPSRIELRIVGLAASDTTRDSTILISCASVGVQDPFVQASVQSKAELRPQPLTERSVIDFGLQKTAAEWIKIYNLRGDELQDISTRAEHVDGGLRCWIDRRDCAAEKVVMLRALISEKVYTLVVVVQ